jgi:hypothetical protein
MYNSFKSLFFKIIVDQLLRIAKSKYMPDFRLENKYSYLFYFSIKQKTL